MVCLFHVSVFGMAHKNAIVPHVCLGVLDALLTQGEKNAVLQFKTELMLLTASVFLLGLEVKVKAKEIL